MAYRTGASIINMAFVQFHPTALVVEGERPFLITEALRGEGAVLLDQDGYRSWKESGQQDPASFSFTLQASSLGSMATRDVVARAIDQRCAETGYSHVYLVTEHLDTQHLNERFPMIAERLIRTDSGSESTHCQWLQQRITCRRHRSGQCWLSITSRIKATHSRIVCHW